MSLMDFHFMLTDICSRVGTPTYKKDELAERVQALLGQMRLRGAVLIAFAVATQVPWVLAIIYFSKGLVYEVLT